MKVTHRPASPPAGKIEAPSGVIAWLWRGFAMGLADMVPGVSGGTIAFITGIYPRFISALAAFGWPLVQYLYRGQWSAAWRRVDGTFLVTLLTGILTAVLAMSHLIHAVLGLWPFVLWGLFLGVLLGAASDLVRQVHWQLPTLAAAGGGALVALATLVGSGIQLPDSLPGIYFGGAIAITAMLLPGVSGSLLLVLMGLYVPVLDAIRSLDWPILAAMAAGCVTGVLVFSRTIHWLLNHHPMLAMAAMTGIVLGAMPRLWPWQSPEAVTSGAWVPLWPADPVSGGAGIAALIVGGVLYAVLARQH